ncbi:MAG: DUF4124 domain-containing protein [Gammaproteobacteria bacterium]|jgi:hypothetical protein|nr:DUF4124 domain-containing protein [Gammaproteobacteria bacterium]
MKPLIPAFSFLLLPLALAGPAVALAATGGSSLITKCQDAEGQWHYGDNASAECARSGVTTINSKGVKVQEEAAPPAPEDVEKAQDAEERARAAEIVAEEQRQQDERLLATYESEEAIIAARDERLAWLESTLQANREIVVRLKKRLEGTKGKEAAGIQIQIADFEKANASYTAQREQIRQRYGRDLDRYRELRPKPESEPGPKSETGPSPKPETPPNP